MSPTHQAIEMIESFGDDFDSVISNYMQSGYVYVSPECFVIAKYDESLKDLFVYLAIGEISELLAKIHMTPKTISFKRGLGSKERKYDFERFIKKTRKKL